MAERAKEGDKVAAKKLRQMENTPLVELDDSDETLEKQQDEN